MVQDERVQYFLVSVYQVYILYFKLLHVHVAYPLVETKYTEKTKTEDRPTNFWRPRHHQVKRDLYVKYYTFTAATIFTFYSRQKHAADRELLSFLRNENFKNTQASIYSNKV